MSVRSRRHQIPRYRPRPITPRNETTRSPRTSLHCFWSRQTVRHAAQPATRAQRNARSAPGRLTRVEALHSTTPHCTQTYGEATGTYNTKHVAQIGCLCQDGRYVTFVGSRSTADAAFEKRVLGKGSRIFGDGRPVPFGLASCCSAKGRPLGGVYFP